MDNSVSTIGHFLMKRLLIIILIILIPISFAWGYRTGKPITLTDLTKPDQVTALNDTLNEFWNILNGRFNLDKVTSDPDGNTAGDIGDLLFFDDSGTYYICVNVDGVTDWECK